mgnify:CR=1 FL=1
MLGPRKSKARKIYKTLRKDIRSLGEFKKNFPKCDEKEIADLWEEYTGEGGQPSAAKRLGRKQKRSRSSSHKPKYSKVEASLEVGPAPPAGKPQAQQPSGCQICCAVERQPDRRRTARSRRQDDDDVPTLVSIPQADSIFHGRRDKRIAQLRRQAEEGESISPAEYSSSSDLESEMSDIRLQLRTSQPTRGPVQGSDVRNPCNICCCCPGPRREI